MKRLPIAARPDWKNEVEKDGVLWTVTENGPYWNEAMAQPVYYQLTTEEQRQLEAAANDIHAKCIDAVTYMLEECDEFERTDWFDRFCIPMAYRQYIIDSWNNDEWTMYGRFDFVMTKNGPRLLEYNADTPTTLIETAISQWNWYKDNERKVGGQQFNELHEALVRHWGDMRNQNNLGDTVYFTAFAQTDDFATVAYIAETATEAGINSNVLPIDQIGWNGVEFTDPDEKKIDTCFKLYPWEWMAEDEFGDVVPEADTRWIEAPWKMLLSNKAILVLLHELYPDCDYIPTAFFYDMYGAEQLSCMDSGKWVIKPLLSREGCNITIVDLDSDEEDVKTDGNYDGECIVQEYIEWEPVDGKYPMMGVWMVGNDAVALGIREDDTCITQNNSRFIPHIFKD